MDLSVGEFAEIIEVDHIGDVRLRNPRGLESKLKPNSIFSYKQEVGFNGFWTKGLILDGKLIRSDCTSARLRIINTRKVEMTLAGKTCIGELLDHNTIRWDDGEEWMRRSPLKKFAKQPTLGETKWAHLASKGGLSAFDVAANPMRLVLRPSCSDFWKAFGAAWPLADGEAGLTALHKAVASGGEVNCQNAAGWTPLMLCAMKNRDDACRVLINARADVKLEGHMVTQLFCGRHGIMHQMR